MFSFVAIRNKQGLGGTVMLKIMTVITMILNIMILIIMIIEMILIRITNKKQNIRKKIMYTTLPMNLIHTFPLRSSCCMSWSLLPMPMKAQS